MSREPQQHRDWVKEGTDIVKFCPKQWTFTERNFKKTKRKMKDMYGRMHDLGWGGGKGKGNVSELKNDVHKTSINVL